MLQRADRDEDGKVSYDELASVRPEVTKERFSALDRDADGTLTAKDFGGPGRGGPGARGARRGGPGDPGARGGGLRDGRGPGRPGRMRMADKDGNGEVTFEELAAVHPEVTKERFSALDRNGDGVLSRADRQ